MAKRIVFLENDGSEASGTIIDELQEPTDYNQVLESYLVKWDDGHLDTKVWKLSPSIVRIEED